MKLQKSLIALISLFSLTMSFTITFQVHAQGLPIGLDQQFDLEHEVGKLRLAGLQGDNLLVGLKVIIQGEKDLHKRELADLKKRKEDVKGRISKNKWSSWNPLSFEIDSIKKGYSLDKEKDLIKRYIKNKEIDIANVDKKLERLEKLQKNPKTRAILITLLSAPKMIFKEDVLDELEELPAQYYDKVTEILNLLEVKKIAFDPRYVFTFRNQFHFDVLKAIVSKNAPDLGHQISLIPKIKESYKELFKVQAHLFDLYKNADDFHLERLVDIDTLNPLKALELFEAYQYNPSLREVTSIKTDLHLKTLEYILKTKNEDPTNVLSLNIISSVTSEPKLNFLKFLVAKDFMLVDKELKKALEVINNKNQVDLAEYIHKKTGKLSLKQIKDITYSFNMELLKFFDENNIPFDMGDIQAADSTHKTEAIKLLWNATKNIDWNLVSKMKSYFHVDLLKFILEKSPESLNPEYFEQMDYGNYLQQMSFLNELGNTTPEYISHYIQYIPLIKNKGHRDVMFHLIGQGEVIDKEKMDLIKRIETPSQAAVVKEFFDQYKHSDALSAQEDQVVSDKVKSQYQDNLKSLTRGLDQIKEGLPEEVITNIIKRKTPLSEDLFEVIGRVSNPTQAWAVDLMASRPELFAYLIPIFYNLQNEFQIEALKKVAPLQMDDKELLHAFNEIAQMDNAYDLSQFHGDGSAEKLTIENTLKEQLQQKKLANMVEAGEIDKDQVDSQTCKNDADPHDHGPKETPKAKGKGSTPSKAKKKFSYQWIPCSNKACPNELLLKSDARMKDKVAQCEFCHFKTCLMCGNKDHKKLDCLQRIGDKGITSYLFPGLQNQGNTCFANSTLKVLSKLMSSHPDFRALLNPLVNKLTQDKSQTKAGVIKESDKAYELRKQFQLILGKVIDSIKDEQVGKSTKLLREFFHLFNELVLARGETFGKKGYKITVQQFDPEEFMQKILDYIEFQKSDLAPKTADALILKNGKIKVNLSPKSIPQIGLFNAKGKMNKDIQQSFNNEFGTFEHIPNYRDDDSADKEVVPMKKTQIFLAPPAFLIVEEKRYEYDAEADKSVKNDRPVEISPELQIKVHDKDLKEVGVAIMRPVGVIVHKGVTTNSGHYYAYIKDGPRPMTRKELDAQQHLLAKSKEVSSDSALAAALAAEASGSADKPVKAGFFSSIFSKNKKKKATADKGDKGNIELDTHAVSDKDRQKDQAKDKESVSLSIPNPDDQWIQHDDSDVDYANSGSLKKDLLHDAYLVAYELVEFRKTDGGNVLNPGSWEEELVQPGVSAKLDEVVPPSEPILVPRPVLVTPVDQQADKEKLKRSFRLPPPPPPQLPPRKTTRTNTGARTGDSLHPALIGVQDVFDPSLEAEAQQGGGDLGKSDAAFSSSAWW